MVSRLSEPQRRGLSEALASQNAVQTVAFYDAVAADEVEMPAMPLGLHAHLTSLAATLSRDAGFLYGVVRRSLGEADANGQLPPLQGELNLPGIGAQAMFNEIHATARAHIDAAREKYVRRAVTGNSPAANALRQIYNARLARPRETKPEGKDPAFNYGGNIQGTTRSFHLAKSPDGAVTVSFETMVRPTNLLIDGNLVPLGAGTEIRGGFSPTFSAEQFDAIGNLDFAGCDNAPADAEINRFPSVADKVSSAVNLLPEAFRFELAPETSFSLVMN